MMVLPHWTLLVMYTALSSVQSRSVSNDDGRNCFVPPNVIDHKNNGSSTHEHTLPQELA